MVTRTIIPWKQTMWQMLAVVVLAAVIGLGSNQWRTDGLPLIGDWSSETRFRDVSGESLVVSIDEARRLFDGNAVIFLDARPGSLYGAGHIQDALSLPWQEVDRYFAEVHEKLDPEKPVITYCDGESCDLSHELALFLKDMGFENVRVLVNGWSEWQAAGLPVDME